MTMSPALPTDDTQVRRPPPDVTVARPRPPDADHTILRGGAPNTDHTAMRAHADATLMRPDAAAFLRQLQGTPIIQQALAAAVAVLIVAAGILW
jgi:hypothetical protein